MRVVRYGDCYLLALSKKRRVDKWSEPKEKKLRGLKVYEVPYAPVGGVSERELPLTLLVEVGENFLGQGRLVGFMLKSSGFSLEDVAELAGTSWHLFVGRKRRTAVSQPVAIWMYASGESVVVCAKGEKRQALDAWLAEARRGRGRKRLWDKAAADRSSKPDVESATGQHILEAHDKEDRVLRLSPIEVFYPFGDVRGWARKLREREPGGDRGSAPGPERFRPTRYLPWHLLPPGEVSEDAVLKHYEGLARRDPQTRYEPERIKRAFSLGPDACYVGTDQFSGYVVFTFPHTGTALLECPIYGHAIYVLDSDWRRLSRLSKRELLADQTRGVRKIVHRGGWFASVQRALGSR
jgi:hypothetical protein